MNKILIFSGAGLSAESGVETFRDSDGLWMGHDPMVVANFRSFPKNRELVRKFYNARRAQLQTVQPNAAHLGIAQLQKDYGSDVVQIFTQNVDDLLERAGCEHVNHVHGFLPWMRCLDTQCGHAWEVGYSEVSADATCPKCNGIDIKPAVVFFHENAPGYEKLFHTFGHSRKDLIIVIGTSGEVIDLGRIATNRRSTNRSTTILNNRDFVKYGSIDYGLFDTCFFKPATQAWPRIRELADQFVATPHTTE